MPVHDWSRVDAGIFHSFHSSWITHLMEAMNGGLLPDGYYALSEQHAGVKIPDIITLHMFAMVEIASPGNKDRQSSVDQFAEKVQAAIMSGVPVLLADVFS